jgi:hypothetical protein
VSWVGALLYCFKLSLRHVLEGCFPAQRAPPPPAPTPPPAPAVSIPVVDVVFLIPRGWPDLRPCTTVYVNILIPHRKKKKKILHWRIIDEHTQEISRLTDFACFAYEIIFSCMRELRLHNTSRSSIMYNILLYKYYCGISKRITSLAIFWRLCCHCFLNTLFGRRFWFYCRTKFLASVPGPDTLQVGRTNAG